LVEKDRKMQEQAASHPEWAKAELPPSLEAAQTQVWESLAKAFAPKRTMTPTRLRAVSPNSTFQGSGRTEIPAPPVNPMVPTASDAALWGFSSGEPRRK
jgi:hypothetical protein